LNNIFNISNCRWTSKAVNYHTGTFDRSYTKLLRRRCKSIQSTERA